MKRFEVVSSVGDLVGRYGIMGLDLGGVSGVTTWIGDVRSGDSISGTLRAGRFEWTQVDCGKGTADGERRGAERIAGEWLDFEFECCLSSVPVGNRLLCIEDYRLRSRPGGMAGGSMARVGLSSPRLAGLVEGMLVRAIPGERIIRTVPATSKSFATNARLKDWGLWCRGGEHARDAARQIAVQVARFL